MESAGVNKEKIPIKIRKQEKIKLRRIRRQFTIKEKKIKK
jgi:hypothetical protein